jgi:hypothetical protein
VKYITCWIMLRRKIKQGRRIKDGVEREEVAILD